MWNLSKIRNILISLQIVAIIGMIGLLVGTFYFLKSPILAIFITLLYSLFFILWLVRHLLEKKYGFYVIPPSTRERRLFYLSMCGVSLIVVGLSIIYIAITTEIAILGGILIFIGILTSIVSYKKVLLSILQLHRD